jgi:hypothetical protein
MSQFFLDVSVNMYESVTIIALMLAIFRFSLKSYIPYTLIAGIVIAQTSYMLRFMFHLDSYTPLFMLLWYIVFVWLVFRIHLFYTLLMVVTGYLSYIVIQTASLLLLQIWVPMDEIIATLFRIKMTQVMSSTITLGIAYWLLKKRIGFSFVPDRIDARADLKGLNLVLLFVSLIACFFISGVAYIFLNIKFLYSTIGLICLLCLVTVFSIIIIALKKEMRG